MIYVDASVALAHIFAEEPAPPASLWGEELVSSRLLEYEVWNRVQGRRLAGADRRAVRKLLGSFVLLDLTPAVLARALKPFPAPLRTLEALHIASAVYVRRGGEHVRLASYDGRMLAAARRMRIPLYPL